MNFTWKSLCKILDLTYLKSLDMKDLNDYKLENLEDEILTQGRNLEALCTNLDLKEGEVCLAKHGCGGDEGFS